MEARVSFFIFFWGRTAVQPQSYPQGTIYFFILGVFMKKRFSVRIERPNGNVHRMITRPTDNTRREVERLYKNIFQTDKIKVERVS